MPRLKTIITALLALAVSIGVLSGTTRAQEKKEEKTQPVPSFKTEQLKFFEKDVKPILVARCFKCHGGEKKIMGGLRLTFREGVLKGGDSGPAFDVKKPADSLFLEAINFESLEMPPTGKLAAKEIAILTRWVNEGLPWTPGDKPNVDPTEAGGPPQVNAETRSFWSYRPMNRPDVPAVKQKQWVKNPIDAFVLAKLEMAGLSPASPAERVVLLRRAYYDLLGLPPTPEEVQSFMNDDSPDAYEKLIDRLLESPHYGEKWGRHWLDLVRYAETNSYERDGPKPHVWRYRDWVIRSLNADKPYDQFLREQLAGDELDNSTPETLIATGFYRLGIWDDEPADPELALYDDLDDILLVTGQVMLGMRINCARCHDHKLDPIPQADYYRLLSFFGGLTRFGVRGGDSIAQRSLRSIRTPQQEEFRKRAIIENDQQKKTIAAKMAAIEKLIKGDLSPEEKQTFRNARKRIDLLKKRVAKLVSQQQVDEYAAMRKTRDQLNRFRPPEGDMVLCVTEIGSKPREIHRLVRGSPQAKAEKVQPGFPSIFGIADPKLPTPAAGAKTAGRRRVLADWIASKDNPRTARVMANRLWQFHFGRGIVRSSNDFGLQGTPPTHPELLDWLAAEFTSRGWRMKAMHKLIMLSNTYRMSSNADPRSLAKDPENNLFWRFNMRRLTAEEVRDSVLAVNGSLNSKKMFGPSIYTIIPAEVLAGQSQPGSGWGKSSPEERARRSVYIHVKRSLMVPVLESFDAADTDGTCPVRFSTTQPTQALGMLNGDFLNREATVFADLLKKQAAGNQGEQVKLALKRALQREPSAKETARGLKFINDAKKRFGASDDDALKYFCLLVLNLNEFLYLD
jgi:hypothetical protein